MPKMIIFIEVASKPKKKYHHHGAQCMPKMIIFIQGASKPKKCIISIEQILCQNWSLSSRGGLKKTQKHNPKQNLIMIEQISCQKWALSLKGLKTHRNFIIFFGHDSPPSPAVAKWGFGKFNFPVKTSIFQWKKLK